MLRDEDTYHEPHNFKPERFLGFDGQTLELDPRTIAFGFGRRCAIYIILTCNFDESVYPLHSCRICPGKDLAETSLFLTIARIIAYFNISMAKDENGQEIQPVCEFTHEFIRSAKR